MKGFICFARPFMWLFFVFPLLVTAQEAAHVYPNYVVIGAFAHLNNAINFTDDAKHNRFPARFEMNPNRNLYYVYVLTTADRAQAIAEAIRLRADTKYFDTWVYSGGFGQDALADAGNTRSQDVDPVTGKKIDPHSETTKPESQRVESVTKNTPTHDGSAESAMTKGGDRSTWAALSAQGEETGKQGAIAPLVNSSAEENASAPPIQPPKRVSTEPLQDEEVAGKKFYFYLFRADNGNVVEGEVEAIDFEKSWKMATYPGNKSVTVRPPSGESKRISFLCQTFGYRKLQKEFDPANPSEELYLDDKGNLVMPFELMRLQKGDIAIMYNVFFFKDAAVMRPESRYEVNNLLDLLKENPSYNIRIHGHTNGNASGKIIRMDIPGNFYSLSGTRQGFGSARKLSEERAIVIKEFLVSSGISEDRMEIKAWGGKKPIHDKHSVRAAENVRVEIEILSEEQIE